MSADKVKICRKCRYSRMRTCSDISFWICIKDCEILIDVVTGGEEHVNPENCRKARAKDGTCGVDGKNFRRA